MAFIALIEQLLGHQDTAHALLSETLAAQPDPGSRVATGLRIELANERYFAADWPAMREHAADALRAARALGDEVLLASAAGMLALAEYHVSDVAAARVLLDEAAARLDALSDDALAGRLDAALWTGWAEQCLARWDDVHRHYARALRVARATGQGYLLVPMTIGRAIAFCWQGELDAAAELADEAIEAAELSGNGQSQAWALTLRCWIATVAGDIDAAVAFGDRAAAIASELAATHWGGLAGCYRAAARLEAGHDVRAELVAAAGGPDLPLIERAYKPQWYEVLTRAELAAAERSGPAWRRASPPPRRGCSRASAPRPGSACPRARDRRSALAPPSNSPAARPHAPPIRRAPPRAHSHQAGNVLEAARAQLLAGQALARTGRTAEATIALTAAAEHPRARRLHDEAALELRRLGRRVAKQGRRAARPERGVEALTDREREIAGLIRAGHTNRRIAATCTSRPRRSRRTSRTSSPSSACATAQRRPRRSPRVLARRTLSASRFTGSSQPRPSRLWGGGLMLRPCPSSPLRL